MYSVSSCTVTLTTSALQHSISDMAQFAELEWNLLHTEPFSMQFLFHSYQALGASTSEMETANFKCGRKPTLHTTLQFQ